MTDQRPIPIRTRAPIRKQAQVDPQPQVTAAREDGVTGAFVMFHAAVVDYDKLMAFVSRRYREAFGDSLPENLPLDEILYLALVRLRGNTPIEEVGALESGRFTNSSIQAVLAQGRFAKSLLPD